MQSSWLLIALAGPPIAAFVSAILLRDAELPPVVPVVINAFAPGAGLSALGRPTLEIVFGVLVGQFAMIVAGGPDLVMLLPFAGVGAVWALAHTSLNPLSGDRPTAADPAPRPAVPPASGASRPAPRPPQQPPAQDGPTQDDDRLGEHGYTVTASCTECGADVEFDVLQHAARCGFCGSHHLVVGHDAILQVAIPERITNEDDLRQAVLDHLRYLQYLKLYERTVAPIERRATEVGPEGHMVNRSEVEAAAARAEEAITRRADAYRRNLEDKLALGATQRFLAPYLHQVATLYQAAYGRDRRTQNKVLTYGIDAVESVVPAYPDDIDLPAMGRLSYLRALVPVRALGTDRRALRRAHGIDALGRHAATLEKRTVNRDIQTIRLGSVLSPEVRAQVWRPWWVVEAKLEGRSMTLLVDGGSGAVTEGAFMNEDLLVPLEETFEHDGGSLSFQPMECPVCGHEFPYETDAAVHFCANCYRVFDAGPDGKHELRYLAPEGEPQTTADLVPFWVFELGIQTVEKRVFTGMAHLRDGIDGTLDQIGEHAREAQNSVWVPAFRCINARLTSEAQRRLFTYMLHEPHGFRRERFPLDQTIRPWCISLEEAEARAAVPLLLAETFTGRDLARVNVHQIENTLFKGRQVNQGTLCFAWIPSPMTELFRRYVGRSTAAAVDRARQGPPAH